MIIKEIKTLKDFDKMMKEIEPFLRKPENFDKAWEEWFITSPSIRFKCSNQEKQLWKQSNFS